ncbi:hypothetical protein EDD85DRAFT_1022159 [Armillaria nabsnona]|nr:hypothetical protein EDD85DRAFT_1022159 [Armillaria nabsnona]
MPLSLLGTCTSPTSHGWIIYATYPRPQNPSSIMTLSPGLLVALPASSTSEKTKGTEWRKRCTVISLRYPTSLVSKLSFQVSIIYLSSSFGSVLATILLRSFHGIPIYARYDRFLVSNTSTHHHDRRWLGKTRMDVYFSMPARDSPVHKVASWSFTLYKLRKVGIPGDFFITGILSPGPYEVSVIDGVRHIRQSMYICETQLGYLDSRDINKRLWIASKRWYRLRYLTSLFYHREFKHGESSLPERVFPTRDLVASRPTLLERENLL